MTRTTSRDLCSITVLSLILLQGCTSVYRGKLMEPAETPSESYAAPAFQRMSHRVPVGLILDDCPNQCQIVCKWKMGSNEPIQDVNLRQIVKRELSKMIGANFGEPSEDVAPQLMLRVDVSRVDLVRKRHLVEPDEVSAAVDFVAKLQDPEDSGRMDILQRRYSFHKEYTYSPGGDGSGHVPPCFYGIATELAHAIVRDIANDQIALARIRKKPGIQEKRMPTVQLFDVDSVQVAEGVYKGACRVESGDWDRFEVSEWAEKEIFQKCVKKLGLPEANVRVVYDRQYFSDGVWEFIFRFFPRRDFVLQYDEVSRQGSVVADFELLRIGQDRIAEVVTARILSEMKKRGGGVRSVDADTQPIIRLGTGVTDKFSGCYKVDFRVSY